MKYIEIIINNPRNHLLSRLSPGLWSTLMGLLQVICPTGRENPNYLDIYRNQCADLFRQIEDLKRQRANNARDGRERDAEEAEVTGQRWQCNSGVIGVINNRLQLSRYDYEEEEAK